LVVPIDDTRTGCAVSSGGADGGGVDPVTADCRWPIPPETVIETVRNQGDIDQVLSFVSESSVLRDGRVMQVHRMGRGLADRQVTLRFQAYALPDGGLRLDFRRAREQESLRDGRVQVARDRGWWEVHPDGRGGTHLRYSVRYDPGGSLQPWLVRRFKKAGIARSMREVRRAAELATPPAPTPPIASGPREPAPDGSALLP
jgi:hypothetical protein